MDTMLSKALRKFTTGPLNQLIVNLGGQDGAEWEQQFKQFLRKEPCWTKGQVTQVTQPKTKPSILGLVSTVKVDFDKLPTVPDGWTILPDYEQLPNRIKGQVEFYVKKVGLHLDEDQEDSIDEGQRGYHVIEGNKLRKKLKDVPVYGAQLLDFYLANQHLIPWLWKGGGVIFFWGTIYRDVDGVLCVRCLYLNWCKWHWSYRRLDSFWGFKNPAVRCVS